MLYVTAAVAALMGALGVAAAAASAHVTSNPIMSTVAQMLMIHSAAAVGLLALGRGSASQWLYGLAAGMMLFGIALFSGDLTVFTFYGQHLFPMAAPTGGTLAILAWLTAAAASVAAWRQGVAAPPLLDPEDAANEPPAAEAHAN